jgi:hypothetical protein
MGRAKVKICPTLLLERINRNIIWFWLKNLPVVSPISIPTNETNLTIIQSFGRPQGRVIEVFIKKEFVHIYFRFTFQAGAQTKLDVFPLSPQKELVN